MATNIEWADRVWNPIVGCTKVSPGCVNCYAERMANRLAHNPATPQYKGLVDDKGRWNGWISIVKFRVDEPLSWRKPSRVFVNSMSDLFHENVPVEYIIALFDVMRRAKQHTFMILTKRAERMAEVMATVMTDPLPNVWFGVSVENQQRADERIPLLLHTPAAVRFISAEPLLGPVNLSRHIRGLDWVICGGETGPRARPMHPKWATDLLTQCKVGVPFFFKSWGEWAIKGSVNAHHTGFGVLSQYGEWFDRTTGWNGRPIDPDTGEAYMLRVGKKAAGRLLDGREWNEYPEASQ